MGSSQDTEGRPDLIVFDLDGTLIDSAGDLCAAVNAMLLHYGKKPLPQPLIASYIGEGAAMLVRRALGGVEDEAVLDVAIRYFLDYYHEHKLDRTRVYPGVFDALDTLRNGVGRRGTAMAVLSNKPVGPAQAICGALGLAPYFFRIYGGNSFTTKKPDPVGLRTLIEEAGAAPDATIMVGDTPVDVMTARNIGARSIGCAYGMASATLEKVHPDRIVASAGEWPSAVASLPAPLRHEYEKGGVLVPASSGRSAAKVH